MVLALTRALGPVLVARVLGPAPSPRPHLPPRPTATSSPHPPTLTRIAPPPSHRLHLLTAPISTLALAPSQVVAAIFGAIQQPGRHGDDGRLEQRFTVRPASHAPHRPSPPLAAPRRPVIPHPCPSTQGGHLLHSRRARRPRGHRVHAHHTHPAPRPPRTTPTPHHIHPHHTHPAPHPPRTAMLHARPSTPPQRLRAASAAAARRHRGAHERGACGAHAVAGRHDQPTGRRAERSHPAAAELEQRLLRAPLQRGLVPTWPPAAAMVRPAAARAPARLSSAALRTGEGGLSPCAPTERVGGRGRYLPP